jgi:hypothetical protein
MSESPIKSIPLKNGLLLEIRDKSRITAGDRWLVRIEARMEIPLENAPLSALPEGERGLEALKKTYGDPLPFQHAQEKHFVDQRDKAAILEGFLENIQKDLLPYLSHPDFPERLILSRCRELKRKNPLLFQEGADRP